MKTSDCEFRRRHAQHISVFLSQIVLWAYNEFFFYFKIQSLALSFCSVMEKHVIALQKATNNHMKRKVMCQYNTLLTFQTSTRRMFKKPKQTGTVAVHVPCLRTVCYISCLRKMLYLFVREANVQICMRTSCTIFAIVLLWDLPAAMVRTTIIIYLI